MRRGSPAGNFLRLHPGWALVCDDPIALLFARADLPAADTLRGAQPPDLPPDGAGLCLP